MELKELISNLKTKIVQDITLAQNNPIKMENVKAALNNISYMSLKTTAD